MNKTITLVSCQFLIAFACVHGQLVYELNDCIRIGLEKNFSLLVTKNSESIAKNNYTPGNAGFLPSITVNGRHGGTINNTGKEDNDGTRGITANEFNSTTTAGVSMEMTIFNGFNARTTYKKLCELKEIGELNTMLAVENLVAGICSGYYNYLQQVQLLNNLEYAVTLSKERLRIDEARYLLRSGSKLQVLQSRVYLNSDSSRLSRQREVVKEAGIRLNELMAVSDLDQQFITKDTSINVDYSLVYENLLDETLARNTRLMIASKNKIVSEYDYKLVTSRSYPYVSLSSGYNYNFNTFSEGMTGNTMSNGFNYGVTLGVNIFDGLNQQRSIRNSSIEIKNKELVYLEVEQGIRADLITIFSAYSNYLRLIALEEQNMQTATENLEIAMERYKLGDLSGIELREVQKSILDARESLLSVQYQAKLAEISLLIISGRIIGLLLV